MNYVSICDGIGAVHCAAHPLGWGCLWTSEIEAYPIAVVDHHWHLPNLGDMMKITREQCDEHRPDLLVGGTPCQSFSVAGLRGGLADPRGNLALRFLQLAGVMRPRWVVWENVPGVLSSGEGRDFGSILGGLAELEYGWSYRVMDAQYFGVAQRRRRVFVVGCLGDWRGAAAVLFERESMSGNPPPRREAGKGTAPALAPSLRSGGLGFARVGYSRGQDCLITGPLCANGKAAGSATQQDAESGMLVTHSLRADGFDASEDGTGRGTPLVPVYAIQERAVSENPDAGPQGKGYQPDHAYTLEARNKVQAIRKGNGNENGGVPCVMAYRTAGDGAVYEEGDATAPLTTATDPSANIIAFAQNQRDEVREMETVGALASEPGMKQTAYLKVGMSVRRITPREAERLQGFPDDYTAITYRKKPAKDGPRYKALGNSMAVPCMRWLFQRIEAVDRIAPRPSPRSPR